MQFCNTAIGACNTAIGNAYGYVPLLVRDDFCTPTFRIALLNKKVAPHLRYKTPLFS